MKNTYHEWIVGERDQRQDYQDEILWIASITGLVPNGWNFLDPESGEIVLLDEAEKMAREQMRAEEAGIRYHSRPWHDDGRHFSSGFYFSIDGTEYGPYDTRAEALEDWEAVR